MRTLPNLTKKAAMKALFQSEERHPEMGNLTAISAVKALSPEFFDLESCLSFILRAVHKDHGVCPHCQAPLSEKNCSKLWKNQQIYCRSCRKKSHGTTGTPIAGSTIGATQVFCMAVLFIVGFSDAQVAEAVGSNHHTVKRWRDLLRG